MGGHTGMGSPPACPPIIIPAAMKAHGATEGGGAAGNADVAAAEYGCAGAGAGAAAAAAAAAPGGGPSAAAAPGSAAAPYRCDVGPKRPSTPSAPAAPTPGCALCAQLTRRTFPPTARRPPRSALSAATAWSCVASSTKPHSCLGARWTFLTSPWGLKAALEGGWRKGRGAVGRPRCAAAHPSGPLPHRSCSSCTPLSTTPPIHTVQAVASSFSGMDSMDRSERSAMRTSSLAATGSFVP